MAPYIMVVILFLVTDRLLKSLAVNDYFEKTFKLVGNLLVINYTKNYQLAFSLPFNSSWAVILIIIIIIALLYYFVSLLYRNSFIEAGILLFIISGAASNLYDRLKYGYVIDYLDLKYFTVFNLADVMIVSGILWFLAAEYKKGR